MFTISLAINDDEWVMSSSPAGWTYVVSMICKHGKEIRATYYRILVLATNFSQARSHVRAQGVHPVGQFIPCKHGVDRWIAFGHSVSAASWDWQSNLQLTSQLGAVG